MLARRFTLVCVLTTLFGMVFAIIVADAGRQPRPMAKRSMPCLLVAGPACPSAIRS